MSLKFPLKFFYYTFSSIQQWNVQYSRKSKKTTVNWDFPGNPNQVYRKLQYGEKIFQKFQGQPPFPRKVVLFWLTKFGIIKTWINIQWLRRFDLRFLQTLKQIYREPQYTEKFWGKFQRLPRFPRKIFLYSSSEFCIFEPFTNIQSHRRFDLGF